MVNLNEVLLSGERSYTNWELDNHWSFVLFRFLTVYLEVFVADFPFLLNFLKQRNESCFLLLIVIQIANDLLFFFLYSSNFLFEKLLDFLFAFMMLIDDAIFKQTEHSIDLSNGIFVLSNHLIFDIVKLILIG